MAELYILPQSTYREPSPQGRRRRRALNTIIEDDDEDMVSPIRSPLLRKKFARDSRRHLDTSSSSSSSSSSIQQWLAPLAPVATDDATLLTPKGFPTPRGRHFMSAPILPSSPSSASFSGEEESSSSNRSSCKSDSWQRQSVMTDVTEFDDLYGVSDAEDDLKKGPVASPTKSEKNNNTKARNLKALPQLQIPGEGDAFVQRKKPQPSPIPPTPPSAMAMSPAMLSFMNAQHAQVIPTISAPPSLDGSLDGSLTSEQLATLSAPATPVIAGDDPQDSGDWAGVQLQPGALVTLHALSGPDTENDFYESQQLQLQQQQQPTIEVPAAPMAETVRPARPRLLTSNISRTSLALSPAQQRCMADLTSLEIPSPGGFFSGLSPRTRTTWHLAGAAPLAEDIVPPTSTTAEQFYRVPWNMDDAPPMPPPPTQAQLAFHAANNSYSNSPVEQVVEMLEPIQEEEPVLTAMRIKSPLTAVRIPPVHARDDDRDQILSPADDNAVTEIVADYDPDYARKQREISTSHINRTELWLRAQFAYLRGVGFEPASPTGADTDPEKATVTVMEMPEEDERAPTPPPKDGEQPKTKTSKPSAAAAAAPLVRKKTVRFSNQLTIGPCAAPSVPCSLPSKLLKQESAYYRAFQSMAIKATPIDAFVHRIPRFEALQAQRVSLREQHRAQLLGKYQLSVLPQSAKKRMSANVARGDDEIFDDPARLRADKEADALRQMAVANWHVAATKLLNGGKLVCAPVHRRLARLSLAPSSSSGTNSRLRILDLGGQATCDWAWHAALQYPSAKVYTVTTKAIRQLSNANIRGPPNHRQVAVTRLARLPFADAQFDLVSARELHSIVHAGAEWDATLREVWRVLKPGGYLDFSVMDAEMVNAGPRGLAASVEFGFTLQTLGYDPVPTQSFLPRLARAGFADARRAWVVLPLGPKPAGCSSSDSTTDGAAAVAAVAGTWSWERWLLRCAMEKAAGETHSGFRLADTVSTDGGVVREAGKSLDGVAAVVEEGRACGAGLRLLKGYARKPEVSRAERDFDEIMGTIDMMLDF